MKNNLILTLCLLFACVMTHAQRADNYPPNNKTITIGSTNLPIVWVEVNGAMILKTEYITAHMKIIDNGSGHLNYGDTVAHPGQTIDYEGYIALRYRGNSSFNHSRKPYLFRPLDKPLEEGGEKKKVKILGMGKDNKWALLAPYSDRSMVRVPLSFDISRPWMEYAPQCRFCELYLDGIYYGVYILTEVVSKGKQRLNLSDPGEGGDDLTGGYILEVDRNEGNVYTSKYYPRTSTGAILAGYNIYFQYSSPDYEDMSQVQLDYINHQIDLMEGALNSSNYMNPETGYRKYIDVENFIDYQIAMELGHNVDAYRLSGKLFKRRDSEDPRFKMVVWDMDLAYGMPYYYGAWRTENWSYEMNDTLLAQANIYLVPFWWYKLNKDPSYTASLKARWAQYRRSNLRLDRLMAEIDSLASIVTSHGAETRNDQAWPRWGVYVWPNNYVPTSYADAIAFLKQWLTDRIAWMDGQLGFDPDSRERGDVNGDYQVTINDVTVLINYLLTSDATGVYLDAADCDLDGNIGISDVTKLINFLLLGNWEAS